MEADASMSSFKDHHPACPECKNDMNYFWSPTVPQIAFKDGTSGWPSKANRFKNYRAKQSEVMEKRQKDRYGHLRTDAIPNFNGKDTGTWQEAQFQALKENGAESASTFKQKVDSEKAKAGKIIL